MDITAEFEFTYELYKRSYVLHRRTVLAKSARRIFLSRVCPAGAFMSLVAACYFRYVGNGDASGIAIFVASALAFWYGCGQLAQWIVVRRGYQSSFPVTAKSKRVVVNLNENVVSTSIADSIRSEIPWADICRVEQDGAFVLLYVNKHRYIPIATETMNSNDAVALRGFVKHKVGEDRQC